MYRLNYCQPGALPPFRAFALTAREGLVALPRVSLPSVAGPGLQALPPAEVEGWPSAILNAAYGAYTMETICGTTHCDCLPDSNSFLSTCTRGGLPAKGAFSNSSKKSGHPSIALAESGARTLGFRRPLPTFASRKAEHTAAHQSSAHIPYIYIIYV